MHELAQERLGDDDRATYVQADFKSPSWTDTISERIEVVVTMQALHELRHSSRSHLLYRQLASVAEPGGSYLSATTYAHPRTRDRCTCPSMST